MLITQLSSTCWHFLFGSWVWMRLSLLFPALSYVDGSWVWKIVSTVFVASLVPGYCIGMVRIVLWIRLGLCVTGLLIFRQPQRPMVVPLVYDEDCLRWGLTETCCCILLIIVLQRCFRYSYDFLHLTSLRLVHLSCQTICPSLSMVSGHEALSLWHETSPLQSLCWNIFFLHQCHA